MIIVHIIIIPVKVVVAKLQRSAKCTREGSPDGWYHGHVAYMEPNKPGKIRNRRHKCLPNDANEH